MTSSSDLCWCTYSELVEDDLEQHVGFVDCVGVDGVEGNRGLAALVVGTSVRRAVDGDPETDDRGQRSIINPQARIADGRT